MSYELIGVFVGMLILLVAELIVCLVKNKKRPEYIALSDAARIAFDKHKDPDDEYYLDFVDFVDGFESTRQRKSYRISPGHEYATVIEIEKEDAILISIATAISRSVQVFGLHQSGVGLIEINVLPLVEYINQPLEFGDNGNSLFKKEKRYQTRTPVWSGLCIKRSCLEVAINSIRSYVCTECGQTMKSENEHATTEGQGYEVYCPAREYAKRGR